MTSPARFLDVLEPLATLVPPGMAGGRACAAAGLGEAWAQAQFTEFVAGVVLAHWPLEALGVQLRASLSWPTPSRVLSVSGVWGCDASLTIENLADFNSHEAPRREAEEALEAGLTTALTGRLAGQLKRLAEDLDCISWPPGADNTEAFAPAAWASWPSRVRSPALVAFFRQARMSANIPDALPASPKRL